MKRGSPKPFVPLTPFVLISRYTDNIYLCVGNCSPTLTEMVKVAVTSLLHSVYGIRLQWEPHGSRYKWGQVSTAPMDSKLSLLWKGVDTDGKVEEWERWVDVTSPHARLVWRSQFPDILQKCIRYTFTKQDILDNLQSVMVGVRRKKYPVVWATRDSLQLGGKVPLISSMTMWGCAGL